MGSRCSFPWRRRGAVTPECADCHPTSLLQKHPPESWKHWTINKWHYYFCFSVVLTECLTRACRNSKRTLPVSKKLHNSAAAPPLCRLICVINFVFLRHSLKIWSCTARGALYTYRFQGKQRSSLLCRIKIYQKESKLKSWLPAAPTLPSLIPELLHAPSHKGNGGQKLAQWIIANFYQFKFWFSFSCL